MKIAVVGCGALGSFYGAKLSRTGLDVQFLARSDYEVIQRDGVHIESPEGNFVARPKVAQTPEEIGVADWVLIGLKTTANDEFPRILPPLVDGTTSILTLQNGLGNEEALAQIFPREQILGGLCFVCLNRVAPGRVQHLAHGKIVLGEFAGAPRDRTSHIAEMFRIAGVKCEVVEDLSRAHWEKLVWNIPFNGLAVASAAGIDPLLQPPGVAAGISAPQKLALGPLRTTDQLLSDPAWAALVRGLMHEIIAVARALGCAIPDSVIEEHISRTEKMGPYRPSTSVDFERRQPLEIESMFAAPLARAREVKVSTPLLERLVEVLSRLDISARLTHTGSSSFFPAIPVPLPRTDSAT